MCWRLWPECISYLFRIAPLPGADLADLLKKNPQDYNFSLGHVLDLTPRALGAFRGPLLGASLGLFLGTGLNWILRRRGRPFAGNVALAAMMIVLLACVHSSFSTFSPILSSYDLAEAIRTHFRPGDVIVIDGEYSDASTLNFYTGIQVHVLHEPSGNLWYGAKFPDAPHIFETQSVARGFMERSGGGVPVDGPGTSNRTARAEGLSTWRAAGENSSSRIAITKDITAWPLLNKPRLRPIRMTGSRAFPC